MRKLIPILIILAFTGCKKQASKKVTLQGSWVFQKLQFKECKLDKKKNPVECSRTTYIPGVVRGYNVTGSGLLEFDGNNGGDIQWSLKLEISGNGLATP